VERRIDEMLVFMELQEKGRVKIRVAAGFFGIRRLRRCLVQ